MSVPLYWRLKKHRYNLTGTKCAACGDLHFPPRAGCQTCSSETLQPHTFSGSGTVISYTIIRTAPTGFEGNTPYCIALIKLDEGPTISAEVVNCENVSIGKAVKLTFRKQGERKNGVIHYSFKFTIAE